MHLSRTAGVDAAVALPEPATAVVVHPPPCEQLPAVDTGANHSNVVEGTAGDSNEANASAEHSSFSLFGMLTRWNKEGDDSLRLQEFQEQVCGSGF